MQARLPNLPQPVPDYLPFTNGLDLVTPVIQTKPGTLRDASNFEIDKISGYRRVMGYERFDGQDAPSEAVYSLIYVTITGSVSVGDTITGATSAATAVVLALASDGSYLVVTKVVGTFEAAGEDLEVSAAVEAASSGTSIPSGASTALLHAQYNNMAADEYRDDIAAVTGSGDILGVHMFNDVVYAWRNNAGATAAAIYKSSASGWTAVALGREVAFTSGGTYVIAEGNTITGATSAATAVITRVVLSSGSWAAGTAAGYLVFATDTGAFQAENLNVGANLNVATIAGDASAITLLPSGRYEIIEHNFGSGRRMYGVDGVNLAFEFDGSVFARIRTGMTTDTPTHVTEHKDHLFLSFGRSVQHSGVGTPYAFTIVTGAGEIATGDTVTGFAKEAGVQGSATLGVYCRNLIYMLYGSSSADWDMPLYTDDAGAYAYSIQSVGKSLMVDDRGIRDLQAGQSYGNFNHSTISNLVQPFLQTRKSTVNDTCIVRDKNQYRVFFADSSALYVTVNKNKITGMMPILFVDEVVCVTSQEANDGSERIYFGSDDGFVYQMERGTSFDGDNINHYLVFHFHHSKSPRLLKGYKSCMFEVDGSGYATYDFTYELGYASTEVPQPDTVTTALSLSSVYWDTFVWDQFIWDGQSLTPANQDLEGDAENISLILRGDSDYFAAIRFSGAILRYIPRRQLR